MNGGIRVHYEGDPGHSGPNPLLEHVFHGTPETEGHAVPVADLRNATGVHRMLLQGLAVAGSEVLHGLRVILALQAGLAQREERLTELALNI